MAPQFLHLCNVHPSKRVTEYSGEHLTVAAGKLFCKACSEILSVKTLYRMISLIIGCFRKSTFTFEHF